MTARHIRYKIISTDGSELFTTAEVKNWLKIDSSITADDTLIDNLVKRARNVAEEYSGMALVQKTVEETFDAFPAEYFELSVRPLVSVTSVKYYNASNTLTTMDSSNYKVDTYSKPGRIGWAANYSFPELYDEINPVVIKYVAGYTSAANVPGNYLEGMMHLIAHWYEHRTDPQYKVPSMVKWLFQMNRTNQFI